SSDVGPRKILALEQVRLATGLCESVGKTVAIIQCGGVASLAVATPGATRSIQLFDIDRDDLGADLEQPKVKFAPARVAEPGLDYDRRFEHGRCRDQAHRVIRNPSLELCRIGSVEGDCHDCGCADPHQRGNPCSSYPTISSGVRLSTTAIALQRRRISAISCNRAALRGRPPSRRNRSSMARLVAVVMFSPVSCAKSLANRSVSGSLILSAIARFLGFHLGNFPLHFMQAPSAYSIGVRRKPSVAMLKRLRVRLGNQPALTS